MLGAKLTLKLLGLTVQPTGRAEAVILKVDVGQAILSLLDTPSVYPITVPATPVPVTGDRVSTGLARAQVTVTGVNITSTTAPVGDTLTVVTEIPDVASLNVLPTARAESIKLLAEPGVVSYSSGLAETV